MATNNNLQDKLSVKNLLFCKAIPNYVIPVPTEGRIVHACKDCGDKFMFESSYEYHMNRKSVQITYMCRPCNKVQIFYNRCNLLAHIRSHSFKTATINVSDLKIEPLPLSFFNYADIVQKSKPRVRNIQKQMICFDCKKDIHETGIAYKDREKHFRENSSEKYTCPICLFSLPTPCSLKAHIRIHLKLQPLFCPECGIILSNKNVKYPFHHNCEGFKIMRETTRINCLIENCGHFNPAELYDHYKREHCKKIYRCVSCSVASYNESSILKHVKKEHKNTNSFASSYQCELCTASLIFPGHLKKHAMGHFTVFVYPCWTCEKVFASASELVAHHSKEHFDSNTNANTTSEPSITNDTNILTKKSELMCRVVKKCDKCNRCFTYKCKYNQIAILPNECPYRCSESSDEAVANNESIICCFCKISLNCNWSFIKNHFAQHHKEHKCLDVQIILPKLTIVSSPKIKKRKPIKKKNITKSRKQTETQKRNRISTRRVKLFKETESQNNLSCKMCDKTFETKYLLEDHLISHRDPFMAYQCLECGECFVGKPSFGTHLVVQHSISDIGEYINKKKCFNEAALKKYQDHTPLSNEPLRENQCAICRDQFENADDLEKHFRVHGMAFLLKNTSKVGASN